MTKDIVDELRDPRIFWAGARMTELATRAADQLEWLRIERDNSDGRAAACVESMQSCDTENSRLRAVIANAPHTSSCFTRRAWPKGRADAACTCWKADAL